MCRDQHLRLLFRDGDLANPLQRFHRSCLELRDPLAVSPQHEMLDGSVSLQFLCLMSKLCGAAPTISLLHPCPVLGLGLDVLVDQAKEPLIGPSCEDVDDITNYHNTNIYR